MKFINLKNKTGKDLKIRRCVSNGGFTTNLHGINEDVPYSKELEDFYLLVSKNKKQVGRDFEYNGDVNLAEELIKIMLGLDGDVIVEKQPQNVEVKSTSDEVVVVENDPQKVEEVCNKLVALFKDCEENPMSSARFVNTLILKSNKSKTSAKDYIINYFEVQNSPDLSTIKGLVKSVEFDELFETLKTLKTSKKINNRLVLYYGAPGTGKTTKAIQENPSAKVIPCTHSMDCDDLFKVVTFQDGKIEYKESPFIEALVNGNVIILDEINQLNDFVIATLQTITDNKSHFTYGDKTYQIKDGFKIIGTMNLYINGIIYPLRPALVDRAEELEHMKCNYKAIFNRAL